MHATSMKPALLAILCLGALHAKAEEKPKAAPVPVPAAAKEEEAAGTDFVRFREDAKGAQLQTAIATYRNAQGVMVELIGAIHIGDMAYYQALNRRFTTCDALLYEMVGEALEPIEEVVPPPVTPEAQKNAIEDFLSKAGSGARPKRNVAPKPAPVEEAPAEQAARDRMSWLHPLYETLKNSLKLESQMVGIDYTKKNFVHADMTARQFSSMQEQRGEGFLQMWLRSVQTQLTQPQSVPEGPGLLKIMEILCRPDSPTELKRIVGRMFDQVEKLMSGMETEQGSVIIVERNKVALEVLKKEIAKGRRHLGIFYGAAHLPDMEKRLVALGFKPEKAEWLTAWDLPPAPPSPPVTGTGAKPVK